MMELSKFRPWSLWSRLGIPNLWNHSFTRTCATVFAFWSLVGTAMVNLLNTSVTTNTFSLPSEAFSNWVKSIATISNGFSANRFVIGGLTAGTRAFATTQRSQVSTHCLTSACMPNQKHLSFNRACVLSTPWCPDWSCTELRIDAFIHSGVINLKFLPELSSDT